MAAPDLEELRADGRLHLSGLSAPGAGVVARSIVEAYVAADHVAAPVDDHLLVQAGDRRGNVIRHVVDHGRPGVPPRVDVSWSLLAVDLAEHSGSRERARAEELVREGLRA